MQPVSFPDRSESPSLGGLLGWNPLGRECHCSCLAIGPRALHSGRVPWCIPAWGSVSTCSLPRQPRQSELLATPLPQGTGDSSQVRQRPGPSAAFFLSPSISGLWDTIHFINSLSAFSLSLPQLPSLTPTLSSSFRTIITPTLTINSQRGLHS